MFVLVWLILTINSVTQFVCKSVPRVINDIFCLSTRSEEPLTEQSKEFEK